MGKIKEAFQSLRNQNKDYTRVEELELRVAIKKEIEALKARVERLEQGSQPDGK